jgi:hypothetical protein
VKYVLPELISQEIISGGIFSQELILAHRNTCIMCSCLLEEIWGNAFKIIIEDNFLWGVMVFNATFNNISVISWWSVFGAGNHRPVASHLQTLSHNVSP